MGFKINNLIKKPINMNFRSIKKLYESDDIQTMQPDMMQQAAPMPPAPVATSMEEMPSFSQAGDQYSEPAQPEALPQPDVMNLTVQELMDRCNKINPLICMGLQQFIDLNKDQILSMTTGEAPAAEPSLDVEPELNFSKAVEPAQPEFSLDQPAEELSFPQE